MTTVALVYTRKPVAWWLFKPAKVSSYIHDDPNWINVRPGADRIVRQSWPLYDPRSPLEQDPGWPGRIERVHGAVVQVHEPQAAAQHVEREAVPIMLLAALLLTLPYNWQAPGAIVVLALVAAWIAVAPRFLGCVWSAKEAMGIRAPWIVTTRQLYKRVERMEVKS